MVDVMDLLKKPSFTGKFTELIFAIAAVITLQDSRAILTLNQSLNQMALVYMVYCGYLLILPMYIIGRLLGMETPKAVEMLWALVGAALWFSAGGLLLKRYIEVGEAAPVLDTWSKYYPEFLATSLIGIFNGVFFLLEYGTILKRE